MSKSASARAYSDAVLESLSMTTTAAMTPDRSQASRVLKQWIDKLSAQGMRLELRIRVAVRDRDAQMSLVHLAGEVTLIARVTSMLLALRFSSSSSDLSHLVRAAIADACTYGMNLSRAVENLVVRYEVHKTLPFALPGLPHARASEMWLRAEAFIPKVNEGASDAAVCEDAIVRIVSLARSMTRVNARAAGAMRDAD
jgi:hypothetical protein